MKKRSKMKLFFIKTNLSPNEKKFMFLNRMLINLGYDTVSGFHLKYLDATSQLSQRTEDIENEFEDEEDEEDASPAVLGDFSKPVDYPKLVQLAAFFKYWKLKKVIYELSSSKVTRKMIEKMDEFYSNFELNNIEFEANKFQYDFVIEKVKQILEEERKQEANELQ